MLYVESNMGSLLILLFCLLTKANELQRTAVVYSLILTTSRKLQKLKKKFKKLGKHVLKVETMACTTVMAT